VCGRNFRAVSTVEMIRCDCNLRKEGAGVPSQLEVRLAAPERKKMQGLGAGRGKGRGKDKEGEKTTKEADVR
jgi:hypothetical protein